jgi:D-alanyl-D-alanine carboxypeptidase
MDKYGLERGTPSTNAEVGIRVSKTSITLNGTSAQLRQGKWMRLEDLLYGTMLPSGNDASYLLSEVMGLLLFY